jgi:hypothetical protein
VGFSPYRKAGTAISPKTRILVLFAITAVVGLVFVFVPRFAQPQSYHSFADHRAVFGIPNFGDVASNLPFAAIGFFGIVFLLQPASSHKSIHFIDSRERWPYLIAFLGIFLTAFGSSYYHLDPNNARLVWDRLPIMVAFTATAAAMVTERVQIRVGLLLLPVFLSLGVASVLLWYASELRGVGDLRFYAAVQVCSTLVLLLVLLFPARYTRGSDLAIVVGLYALAKISESLDKQVFHFEPLVSGHTLKHLIAAAAGYWLLRMLRKRHPVAT